MKSSFTTVILTALFLVSTVTFSFAQVNWTRQNDGNPVLDPGPSGAWDNEFVGSPSVLFYGNTYHMWYWGGTDYNLRGIGYATSPDGITWTKYDDSTTTSLPFAESDRVLYPGQQGTWDDASVATPSVLLIESTYHMWYAGTQDPTHSELISIGHATSTDGINWQKDIQNNPVLHPGVTGTWDDVFVFGPWVLFDGSIYHMWYNAWNGSQTELMRIGHATSLDAITWTKNPNNPVLSYGSPGDWDNPRVDNPKVVYDGATFHMWYSGGDLFAWRIGYATSEDGSSWTKDASNPVLNWGAAGNWDDGLVGFCSVILDSTANIYNMWYTGGDGVWDGHIGYATATITGLEEVDSERYPEGFVLQQNYPNPFNPATIIRWQLAVSGHVDLSIYNILGQKVATLVNKKQQAGSYQVEWDAAPTSGGQGFASGVYYYRLEAGSFVETKKLVLLK